jgi:hypothetical protein
VLVHPTLASIGALIGSPTGAAAAWAHFLAFDLFVGRWIFLDAREREVPTWMVSALLVVTLILGPLGFASYLGVRSMATYNLYERMRGALLAIDERNRVLWRSAVGFAALYIVFLAIVPFDSRTIVGLDPWIKPSKFAISIAIYLATMAWLVGLLDLSRRRARFVAVSLVSSMVLEMVMMSMQAARGTTSHFNIGSGLDSAVFLTMGVVITYAAGIACYVLYEYVVRPPRLPAAVVLGIRLGLAVFLLANVEGMMMAAHMSHSVGGPDGGPGLPYVNWSTSYGDLRVAHFVGLHALQILPGIGYALATLERRWHRDVSRVATVVIGALYLLAVIALAAIAFVGVPLVRG